jgi:hypothetical protein
LVSGDFGMTLQAESSRPVDEATLATPPPPSTASSTTTTHTHTHTPIYRPPLQPPTALPRSTIPGVFHTSTRSTPQLACDREAAPDSFCRRPQTQPARAHHDYIHEPRQASIPLIPCLSRPKGHRPGLANIAARADIPDTLHGHGCTGRCASQRVALCQ